MSSPSRVGGFLASAQDAIRDLRSYSDFRVQRVRLGVARVQALCAIAAAIDRLADALTTEEKQ